ncbi:MAG: C45 family peptidase [Pirellulales bacterium]
MSRPFLCLAVVICAWAVVSTVVAQDKAEQLRAGVGRDAPASTIFARPTTDGGSGHRITVGEGSVKVPVVLVRGTPYEMGYHLGQQTRDEIRQFVPAALSGISRELGVSQEVLCEVWSRSAAYADDRVEQELAGLADGSGLPLSVLQAVHAVPLLMPYSCSSISAWGEATADGHLYQTRNLDWSLEVGAHEFPVIVMYVPDHGIPHIVPAFAGMIGAHTGMNARGIVLSEMGDAAASEMPYQVHAPHFTVLFRNLLYDADSLSKALEIFQSQPLTKRYHYVFGDGQKERRAVKIRAHSPESPDQQVTIWKDNDPTDEFAPHVLSCVVYNDEGRGAFPTLQSEHGKLNGEALVELANQIPIKGGNVVNVVYDATDLRMWISFAKGDREAYQRPYTYLDLKALDVDRDGKPDLN